MKGNSIAVSIAALTLASLGFGAADSAAQAPPDDRMKRHERIIERFDQDGDGLLSIDEFEAPRRADRRFDLADADGDGMITMAEIEAKIREESSDKLARAEQMFVETDLDEDGAITELERKTAMFNRVDEDGNGYVSGEELAALRDKRGDKPRRTHRRGR